MVRPSVPDGCKTLWKFSSISSGVHTTAGSGCFVFFRVIEFLSSRILSGSIISAAACSACSEFKGPFLDDHILKRLFFAYFLCDFCWYTLRASQEKRENEARFFIWRIFSPLFLLQAPKTLASCRTGTPSPFQCPLPPCNQSAGRSRGSFLNKTCRLSVEF